MAATSIILMPNIHQECTDVYPPVSFFQQKMSTSFHWCISHSRECIKIPFGKMWSLILWGWPSQHLLNQVSITFLMSSPPCHYVPQHSAPSHQTPAGFKGPTIISCLMQKHVKAWQKLRSKSHFMRSLRTFVHDRSEKICLNGGIMKWKLLLLKVIRINVLRLFKGCEDKVLGYTLLLYNRI